MRTLPIGMQEHLDTRATTLAWCWRVESQAGDVLGFTDHDRDLTFGGATYKAASGFTGSALTHDLGLAVSDMQAEGALQSAALTEADLLAGRWDDAAVQVWRVNWQDTSQAVLMRSGNIGEVSRRDQAFSAELRGLAHRWQQPRGRLFGRTCGAGLGDGRCRVDIEGAAYKATATVQSLDGSRLLVTGLNLFADHFFARGTATFESGANAGLVFQVVGFTKAGGQALTLQSAPVLTVGGGDTVTVRAGCDKRFSTCRDKFGNQKNFQGFPHMPGDEFVLQSAAAGPNAGDGTRRYGKI